MFFVPCTGVSLVWFGDVAVFFGCDMELQHVCILVSQPGRDTSGLFKRIPLARLLAVSPSMEGDRAQMTEIHIVCVRVDFMQ